MNGIFLLLVIAELAVDGAAAVSPTGACPPLRVEVRSDLHFSEDEAAAQARQKLEDALAKEIAPWRPDNVPPVDFRRRLPKLLSALSVPQSSSTDVVEKPYGKMFRRHIAVAIPGLSVQRWAEEVAAEHNTFRRRWAAMAVITVIGWLCGCAAVVKIDHVTRGYCRGPLLVASASLLLVSTAAGWFWGLR